MLCDAVHALGRLVPEHVAIIGVDNDPGLCVNNQPPLTSIDTAQREQGRRSALELDRLMRGNQPLKHPEIITPLVAYPRQSTQLHRLGNDGLTIALDYLRSHLTGPDAIDRLPSLLATSRSSIYRMFQRAGLSQPAQVLLRMRIERAQHLLVTTSLSLKEVAELSGLHDPSRMCRVFSTQVGLTPNQFRQAVRG